MFEGPPGKDRRGEIPESEQLSAQIQTIIERRDFLERVLNLFLARALAAGYGLKLMTRIHCQKYWVQQDENDNPPAPDTDFLIFFRSIIHQVAQEKRIFLLFLLNDEQIQFVLGAISKQVFNKLAPDNYRMADWITPKRVCRGYTN